MNIGVDVGLIIRMNIRVDASVDVGVGIGVKANRAGGMTYTGSDNSSEAVLVSQQHVHDCAGSLVHFVIKLYSRMLGKTGAVWCRVCVSYCSSPHAKLRDQIRTGSTLSLNPTLLRLA